LEAPSGSKVVDCFPASHSFLGTRKIKHCRNVEPGLLSFPAGGIGAVRSCRPRGRRWWGRARARPAGPGPWQPPLSLSNHKSRKPVFEGDRYHTLAFREFVSDRMNASVRVRGVDAQGVPFSASIPCNYRWMDHVRQRDLATIYSWVDYVTEERGYDASEVGFLTLTVRHPRKHTYRAASQCVDDLRRAWSLISHDFRQRDWNTSAL